MTDQSEAADFSGSSGSLAYSRGHILFVKHYGDGGDGEAEGYYGFIHPFGASGRKRNVYFTDKQVTPALHDAIMVSFNNFSLGPERVEVTFRQEQTSKGPRATEVFLR